MKKTITLIISILLIMSLCSCSSGSYSKSEAGYYDFGQDSATCETEEYYGYSMNGDYMPAEEYDMESEGSGDSVTVGENAAATDRKLIRTFSIDAETTEFDRFISSVQSYVSETGGYIESSNISGNGYSYDGNRYADFTIRIPSEKADDFIGKVDGLANIISKYENQQDITLTYVDTEARIKTLNTEYDRLLELMESAQDIDTVIALESRLSEVRYELESYQSQLRTYDNKIDYSTVSLYVSEVERITEQAPQSIWERIENEFSDNVYDVWTGLQEFFIWLVTSIPYFAVIALVIVIFILIIRLILNLFPGYRRKREERKRQKAERKALKKALNENPNANAVTENIDSVEKTE